jgi:hypothetical protein
MIGDPPRPYCLSRQHPELASRSSAPSGPLDQRHDLAVPEIRPSTQGISEPLQDEDVPASKLL